MARRKRKKKRRSRKRKAVLSIFGIAALAKAFLFPFTDEHGGNTIDLIRQGKYSTAIERIVAGLTGLNIRTGRWSPADLKEGLLPLVGFGLVRKFARKIGINRYIKQGTMGLLEV